jgi:hypothetical protein
VKPFEPYAGAVQRWSRRRSSRQHLGVHWVCRKSFR